MQKQAINGRKETRPTPYYACAHNNLPYPVPAQSRDLSTNDTTNYIPPDTCRQRKLPGKQEFEINIAYQLTIEWRHIISLTSV